MNPPGDELDAQIRRLERRYQRERQARLDAEAISEQGLRALYEQQQRAQLLQKIATAANNASTAQPALETALEELCLHTGWVVGHVLMPDSESNLPTGWISSGLWYSGSSEIFNSLKAATPRGMPVDLLNPSVPNTPDGDQVEVIELAMEMENPRARLAMAAGLNRVLCFPVIIHGGSRPVALLEFFSRQTEMPESAVLEVVVQAAIQLGRVFEREAAAVALQQERALLAERVEQRTIDLSSANAQLAKAARLKDEFLAAMSHELRTPLNTVLGLGESLQEGIYGVLNEDQSRTLKEIENSGRHLLSLINDILDLSKIGAGKVQLDLGEVDIQHLCQSSLRLIKQLALQKRISPVLSVDDRCKVVTGDERRLKQVLVNLLSNAVKFTPEGGSLGLEVRPDPEGGGICFTVWDTGIGISGEDQAKLFQPFIQVDSRLARQYSGTGLGLALVRGMTGLHGGSVAVESSPGKGSRFCIRLPWQPTTDAGGGGGPSTDRTGTAMSVGNSRPVCRATGYGPILLADDNDVNRRALATYLRSHGFDVVEALNGEEAVGMASSRNPALILMDMQMPTMDGLAATLKIKADPVTSKIPIFALTSLAMSGDREKCMEAGAVVYLNKPVAFREVVRLIESHLIDLHSSNKVSS